MVKKKVVENPHVNPEYAKALEGESAAPVIPRRGLKSVTQSLTDLALITKDVSAVVASAATMADDAGKLRSKLDNLMNSGRLSALDSDVSVLISDMDAAMRLVVDSLVEVQNDRK